MQLIGFKKDVLKKLLTPIIQYLMMKYHLIDSLKLKIPMIKPYPNKKFTCAVALALVALIVAGCGKARVDIYHEAGDSWDYPKSVAVLPFSFDSAVEENKSTHSILRKAFFNYFSYLGYNDIPLNTVDLKLGAITKTGVTLDDISTDQLMKVLKVDAVVRGHVINSTNFTAGIYAQTSIEAKLEMIDLRTDTMLWNTKHNEIDSSGIITPSLVDFIKDQADNARVRESYNHIAETFALKILSKIPDPASLRQNEVRLPQIASVETNIKGNYKLRPNDLIYVSMKGEPGLVGHFDIGNFKTAMPMKEVSPGLYTGSYRVKSGDKIDNALIIASLSNEEGLIAKKFYKKALAIKEAQTQALLEKNEH